MYEKENLYSAGRMAEVFIFTSIVVLAVSGIMVWMCVTYGDTWAKPIVFGAIGIVILIIGIKFFKKAKAESEAKYAQQKEEEASENVMQSDMTDNTVELETVSVTGEDETTGSL